MNPELQNQLKQTARKSQDLMDAGLISPEKAAEIDRTAAQFSMAITSDMMALLEPSIPENPIARQFVPTAAELRVLPEEDADPIGDAPFSPIKGITHRYPDRLLLKLVHVCPVYCRFCFRREKVGTGGEGLSPAELSTALAYIRKQTDVWEVILSGGDPLILPSSRLEHVIRELDAIDHVDVIRIHTRVPVVDPQRVDTALIKALKVKTPVYVVLHANHPLEITASAEIACAALVDAGIPMLSQSVLLKGVNDDPKIMTQLMRAFIRNRIKPYYLHHGDLAQGTSHFRTSIKAGQEIMRLMRGRVSGLCQPTYILDIPGGYGKVPIGPQYLYAGNEEDMYQVEDPWSKIHEYPPEAKTANSEKPHNNP